MPLKRCPEHGLLYNDLNPRGCPACWQATRGRQDQSAVMQELARASRKSGEEPEPPPRPKTPAPRPPSGVETHRGRWITGGIVAIGALVGVLVLLNQPRFVELPEPPTVDASTMRPFAVNPRASVDVVFSILGARAPGPHPQSQTVFRYNYGTGLNVDAIDGTVYAINVSIPGRSWRGLQVGMTEQQVQGALALLGTPTEGPGPTTEPDRVVGGYRVYASTEARPTRTMRAEVRPPNGCFDAVVTLRPRQIGIVLEGNERYSAVSREGRPVPWVATAVSIIDRSRRGPYGDRAC